MPFNQRPAIVLPIAVLLIAGGISYTVVEDLLKQRRFVRLALDSKLVLVTSAALVVLGTVAVLFTERANPDTLGDTSVGPRLLNAFFTRVTPRTAGFNTVDTTAMTENGLFVLIALMFVGGAAGSTAGGIKSRRSAFCVSRSRQPCAVEAKSRHSVGGCRADTCCGPSLSRCWRSDCGAGGRVNDYGTWAEKRRAPRTNRQRPAERPLGCEAGTAG